MLHRTKLVSGSQDGGHTARYAAWKFYEHA